VIASTLALSIERAVINWPVSRDSRARSPKNVPAGTFQISRDGSHLDQHDFSADSPGRLDPTSRAERQSMDACCAGHDAVSVLRREELRHRDRSCNDADELVHRRLAGLDRPKQSLRLGRRRLQTRQITGELIHWQHSLITSLLVLSHRAVKPPPPRECCVERRGQFLGITESVADSLGRNRVLVVTGSPTSAQPGPYGLRK
jgi:hypothetical protein